MHATSELREWFLDWLDGDDEQSDAEAVAQLEELRLHGRVTPNLLPVWQPPLAFRCFLWRCRTADSRQKVSGNGQEKRPIACFCPTRNTSVANAIQEEV